MKPPISGYTVINHLLLNHPYQEVTKDKLRENLMMIGQNFTDGGKIVFDYVSSLYQVSTKRKLQEMYTYGDLFEKAKDFFLNETTKEEAEKIMLLECIPAIQNERLYTIRRFLYTRGKQSKFRSHSKTRDPLGQMLTKMFPSYNMKLEYDESEAYVSIKSSLRYKLSDILFKYLTGIDETFDTFRNITRQEMISFIEEKIRTEYYGEDYRGKNDKQAQS